MDFVLRRLHNAGHTACIVGGAVRDLCLNRPVIDWDIATSASPAAVGNLFSCCPQFTLKGETVTLIHCGRPYQITTYRSRPPSLPGDLALRDFTVNAMAWDPRSGTFADPWGGREDLGRGLIRAVGDPTARFREDPLRLLRAVRLAAELDARLHPGTLSAMLAAAGNLHTVAAERIREEIVRTLATDRVVWAFNRLRATGLLAQVLPELLQGHLKRQNPYHRHTIFKHLLETAGAIRGDPLLRLAGLLHDVAKPFVRERAARGWRFPGHAPLSARMAARILERLRFPKATTARITHLVRHHMVAYSPEWSDAAVRRLIRRVGPAAVMDLIALRRADLAAHGTAAAGLPLLGDLEERVRRELQSTPPLTLADLAVRGHDVMAGLGLRPGPAVGAVLRELLEQVLEDPSRNTRHTLLRRMHTAAGRDPP